MDATRRFDNPFTPSFGEIPLYLAGRNEPVTRMARAFKQQSRSPFLSTLISGPRGTGKTVLMSYLAQQAEALGWIAVQTSAVPGMLEDIYEQTFLRAQHLLPPKDEARLTGISAGGLGASWEFPAHEGRNWRTRMSGLLDQLAVHDTGLLICVDELNPSLDEIEQLAVIYQHFVIEGRRVALLMAGLPRSTSSLLSGKSTSFFRRAQKQDLGRISRVETTLAFERTFEMGGKSIDQRYIDKLVEASFGYPYLIQLLGFWVWEFAEGKSSIPKDAVDRGIRTAQEQFSEQILAPSFGELSEKDQEFLYAMLEDEDSSLLVDIARRLDRGNSYAAQYKRRLLDAGVIEEAYDRSVFFALPGMREFVEGYVARKATGSGRTKRPVW